MYIYIKCIFTLDTIEIEVYCNFAFLFVGSSRKESFLKSVHLLNLATCLAGSD